VVPSSAFSELQVWPDGAALPPLTVNPVLCTLAENHEGLLCLKVVSPQPWHVRWLPDEFYARELADLDLTSDDALLGFVHEFGHLYLPDPPDPMEPGEALLLAEETESENHDDCRPEGVLPDLYGDPAVLRAIAASPPGGRPYGSVSLAEARLTAGLLRDMTRIIEADAGALTFADVFASWESPLTRARPTTSDEAISQLSVWLELGLRAVHPTVARRTDFWAGQPPQFCTGTFEAVCAQLFNKIASGTGFRRCGNPTCDRLFSRQRTKAGATRPGRWSEEATGLKFCGPECAQSQAARARRDNIRSADLMSQDGRSTAEIAAAMGTNAQQVEGWLRAAIRRRKMPTEG